MNITSVLGNNWVLRKYNTNLVEKYKEKYSFDEVIARILVLKNINEDKIEDFLNPTIKQTMPNPYILKDMDKAVKKISESISNKETIGIFGDYDVDGASATALLAKFFNYINHPYETYIPDRVRDGYGPSANTLSTFIKKKIKTVITVDCGTVSFDAFDFAKNSLYRVELRRITNVEDGLDVQLNHFRSDFCGFVHAQLVQEQDKWYLAMPAPQTDQELSKVVLVGDFCVDVEEVYACIRRHRGDHCPEAREDFILINCQI